MEDVFLTFNNKKLVDTPEFKVSSMCLETHPCQHQVTSTDGTSNWRATDIINHCTQNDIPVPEHFDYLRKEYPELFVKAKTCSVM